MATRQPSPASPQRARSPLAEVLVTLAGTPDDTADVDAHLCTIVQLSADRVASVRFASVTARHAGAYTTVATSSEIATAVDEAQYAAGEGPCLDAVDGRTPVTVPDVTTTIRWPNFRDTAFSLGLRASLSIPLFAGRGEPVAALNLYGPDPATMAPLTAAVWAAFDIHGAGVGGEAPLEPGAAELVAGLVEAFEVRDLIHRALGVIVADRHEGIDQAYLVLRGRAVRHGSSLVDTASAIIAGHG